MSERKQVTKYIREKFQKLVDLVFLLERKMKDYKQKSKEFQSSTTGYDEGQLNFYQKSIEVCKDKIREVRRIIDKIVQRYNLSAFRSSKGNHH